MSHFKRLNESCHISTPMVAVQEVLWHDVTWCTCSCEVWWHKKKNSCVTKVSQDFTSLATCACKNMFLCHKCHKTWQVLWHLILSSCVTNTSLHVSRTQEGTCSCLLVSRTQEDTCSCVLETLHLVFLNTNTCEDLSLQYSIFMYISIRCYHFISIQYVCT